ncbi:MAG: mechanosensitive ion channel [Lachnospiraceae bacterium]|nr:mechanosensitive ion channel [Lachnospiraceae bacterium]
MKLKTSVIIRLIVCVALLLVVLGIGSLADGFGFSDLIDAIRDVRWVKVLVLFAMIFGVIAFTTLLEIILKLFEPNSHRARSVLSIFSSLIKYVSAIVILCWGLTILGVNVSTIVASVGIIALIIGFSAESLIADVVTGTFMLFENQYNVGDIVEVGGFRGTVTNIGIRTTSITDMGGNVKIVNNSAMTNILNRSNMTSRSVSDIAVPYGTDLEKLEAGIPKLMTDILAAHPDVMKAEPRYLGVQELADSAVVLRFVVDVEEKDIYSGARILNHDLLLGFRRLGVECPFPQMDVHFDKPQA